MEDPAVDARVHCRAALSSHVALPCVPWSCEFSPPSQEHACASGEPSHLSMIVVVVLCSLCVSLSFVRGFA